MASVLQNLILLKKQSYFVNLTITFSYSTFVFFVLCCVDVIYLLCQNIGCYRFM